MQEKDACNSGVPFCRLSGSSSIGAFVIRSASAHQWGRKALTLCVWKYRMVKTRAAFAIFGVDNTRALREHFCHQPAPASTLSQRAGRACKRDAASAGFTDGSGTDCSSPSMVA